MAGKPQDLSQFLDASMNNLDTNTIWFRDGTFKFIRKRKTKP